MTLPVMAQVAQQKGIELLATGDWTHPVWFRELQSFLDDAEEGLYRIKKPVAGQEKTRFLLSVEIATIFSQNGKGRRIHQLVFVPSFDTAAKINRELTKQGCNLSSDGRPIIGLSSKNLLQLILDIDKRCLLIPAHAWTPWFGVYGQKSGFNSLQEAFEELSLQVYGIETGLSSDPEMNWRMDELQNRSILSFSDAHSPNKMGREATVFRLENLSYENIRKAIMSPSLRLPVISNEGERSHEISRFTRNDDKVLYTIEFYPEEGKYHYSGHRNCGISMTPEEQKASNGICPICHRLLTDGVMHRVQELAQKDDVGTHQKNTSGVVWITNPKQTHPPFVKIVPLLEIIAEAIGSPVTSSRAAAIFDTLCAKGQSEFHVLLNLPLADVERIAQTITTVEKAARITDAIKQVRSGGITVVPGYDGVFGAVKIWQEDADVAKNSNQPASPPKQTPIPF